MNRDKGASRLKIISTTLIIILLMGIGNSIAYAKSIELTDMDSGSQIGFRAVSDIKTPLQTYPISTSDNTPTYTEIEGAQTGTIYASDLCTILDVYSSGYCRVKYPISGGTRTQYAKLSSFFNSTASIVSDSVVSNGTAYRRSSGTATIGSVNTTDDKTVWRCGNPSNGRSQIIYRVTGTNNYKLGWVQNSVLKSYSDSSGNMTLAQLKTKFPSGKYWNHGTEPNDPDGYTTTPCSHHTGNCNLNGSCGCNSFNNGDSIQCMGFAYKLGYDYYGSSPRYWSVNRDVSALNSLKPGDIIRYGNHSIFVTAVNDETITYADCNSDGRCKIRWDQTTTKSTIKGSFKYLDLAPYALVP